MFKVGDKAKVIYNPPHSEPLGQFAALHRTWWNMPKGIVTVVRIDETDPLHDGSICCEADMHGWWIPARYLELVVEPT